jgi:MEDS: MEthanogen/methylotroph, DcmR Sensory domain/Histidine kinase-like ATPase domain
MTIDIATRLSAGDHVVRFYETDDELTELVVAYTRDTLTRGGAAVLIATAEHERRFRAGLADDQRQAGDRLVFLSADDFLARLMRGAHVDWSAVARTLRPLLERVLASGSELSVYGEMVALLLEHGKLGAALELEQAWNDLGGWLPFSLLCAYPTGHPKLCVGQGAGEDHIRRLHTSVLEPAPRPAEAEWSCAFAVGPTAPAQARRFVTAALRTWRAEPLADDAALLVTELATNAVRHARSGFSVSLSRHGGVLRISVGDAATALEPPRSAPSLEQGRGMHLIEGLSRAWGVEPVEGGKLVWAEMALPAADTAAP